MIFRKEIDGQWTGPELKNSEPLPGEIHPAQAEYYARKIAADTMDTAERRGYGLGECGYYLMRDCGELVEFDIATQAEASQIYHRAEELMYQAEDLGMTIDAPYNSSFEDRRRVKEAAKQ